eukprot:jgi/Orpsp1_1/1177586/evm.model.c7180000062028.1
MFFRRNKGKEKDEIVSNNSESEDNTCNNDNDKDNDNDNNNDNKITNEKSLIVKDKERPCLLPVAIASRITTMATSSCLTIRNASSIVDTLYELAKAGTDASFDISRNILIGAIKIARSIHRDEENENPNSFIKTLDACTDFGINVINDTFSLTEVMTLTSFHLAQKGLRYTFKWAEEALNILDSVFGKTETSREISALLSLVQSEIKNYVKNESNIIKKGIRSINFIKAITAYACLQIMTYETILKKRKLTLLYEGNTYLESVPLNLIESEENDFFAITDNNNDNDDDDDDSSKSSNSNKDIDSDNSKKSNIESKKTRNETTKLLLSTLALSKSSLFESKNIDSPLESEIDDKKSYLDEAIHNMNNYSPSFASSISDKLDPEILSRSSQEELSSSENSLNDEDEVDPEEYIYPKQHLVKNITKFIRFASGVYGRHFMRFLDIGEMRETTTVDTYLHPNDYAFSIHTKTPLENILYSSYSSKTTSTTNNIAHIISVDHDMKAIIVSLRGTLGFYDFIIDLEFDYETIEFNGKKYHVHSGIYNSAKIISQPNSVIHNIVRVALNDYPDYGLILCGHSLGGGVAAMLGLLWTNPEKPYITSVDSKLPPNRPLHVYSYGTPSCMDESLAKHCRKFLTTVVNHYDIIPRLSIGILTDLRNCADELLNEKNHGLAEEIFSRSLATFNKSNSGKELNWFWDKFLHLKKHMNTEKLLPPGVVYIIETADVPVLDQSNYEINNLSGMPEYNEYLESNRDNYYHNENGTRHRKKLSTSSDQNLAYVDMIIDSIHSKNPKSPVYDEPVIEEEDDEEEMDEDMEMKMNDALIASTSHPYSLNNKNKKEEKEKDDNDEKNKNNIDNNNNNDNDNNNDMDIDENNHYEELKEESTYTPIKKVILRKENSYIPENEIILQEENTYIPKKEIKLQEDIKFSSSSEDEHNETNIEESSLADIDDDEEIIELNVLKINKERKLQNIILEHLPLYLTIKMENMKRVILLRL